MLPSWWVPRPPFSTAPRWVQLLIPFIKMEAPYDEFKEFVEKMWDWWMEEGKNRERLGETIKRQGLRKCWK